MKSVVFLLVFLFTGNVLAGEVTVVDAKVVHVPFKDEEKK